MLQEAVQPVVEVLRDTGGTAGLGRTNLGVACRGRSLVDPCYSSPIAMSLHCMVPVPHTVNLGVVSDGTTRTCDCRVIMKEMKFQCRGNLTI